MNTSWPVCSALVQYLVMCIIPQMANQHEGDMIPNDNTERGNAYVQPLETDKASHISR